MFRPLHTVRGKFTFYLSLFVVLVTAAMAGGNILRERDLMRSAITREGRALAEAFAVACTNTMLYEEVGLVEEAGLLDNYVSDIMQRKDFNVKYAAIIDQEGRVLAHSSVTEVGRFYRDEATSAALRSWDTLIRYPDPDVLDVSAPLAISTKRWGALRIGISLDPLRKEIRLLIAKHALFAFAVVLGGIAVVAFLSGFVTKPLKRLTQAVDETEPGNEPDRFLSTRRDEIGLLQRSFYRLLKRIREDEMEKESVRRNLALTEKMAAIGKLTSGMAHEINNPLGGILNCIHNLKTGKLPEGKLVEYLQLMEDGLRRIQSAVSKPLQFIRESRMERGPINVPLAIERALTLLGHQLTKGKIEISRQIPAELPEVSGDVNQIDQVLVNVFLNAIQAMEQGGVLTVTVVRQEERLLITVSDTGSGISPDVLPRVFDPFFTTKDREQGTGLGLWIAQGIVERHGGAIRIASLPGQGTSVGIGLPAAGSLQTTTRSAQDNRKG